MKIKDGNDHNYVKVDENCALLVKNIGDLLATLVHCGAYKDTQIKMKDADTGEYFLVSYLGKEGK